MSKIGFQDPAKSMVGPLEELHLISYIADGDVQEKVEKALKNWSDKWLVEYGYKEVIDTESLNKMEPAAKDKFQANLIQQAKQALGEAVAISSATFEEGPLIKPGIISRGNLPETNYRFYKLFAVRRWEK